jgi:hypothetical protein
VLVDYQVEVGVARHISFWNVQDSDIRKSHKKKAVKMIEKIKERMKE